MRTLFIAKEIPYPPRGGVSLRNWQNMNAMMAYGPVALFTTANWTPKRQTPPGITVWKHANIEHRSIWERLNRRLWWLYPNHHPDADWAYSKQAAQELNQLLTEFKPDLVIFEEVWLYPYLRIVQQYPCQIILDNHNVEASLWEQNYREIQDKQQRLKADLLIARLKTIEKDFSHKVDQVWVCSSEDAVLMATLYGTVAPIHVVPNAINISFYDEVRSGLCNRPSQLQDIRHNILFLGQLSYKPNTVAAELLIQQIYPRLKSRYPDCRLLLVGRKPTAPMLAAAKQDPGIIVTGGVPDVRPYLASASVMVVPLLQGGGTRLKILEAFAAGCPVISTSKGAEGLTAEDGKQLLIRDSADTIVEAVHHLWTNPSMGKQLTHDAYQLVNDQYSWAAINRHIQAALGQEALDNVTPAIQLV
jgi:glycosyltransferase involved in cell wall biosynthesis